MRRGHLLINHPAKEEVDGVNKVRFLYWYWQPGRPSDEGISTRPGSGGQTVIARV